MDIANNFFTVIPGDPLYSLSDNGASEVPYVKRFGNVGSAVIENDGGGLFRRLKAELFRAAHLTQVVADKVLPDLQVKKTRLYSFRR